MCTHLPSGHASADEQLESDRVVAAQHESAETRRVDERLEIPIVVVLLDRRQQQFGGNGLARHCELGLLEN